jgi:AcrR family transcriptional regulator
LAEHTVLDAVTVHRSRDTVAVSAKNPLTRREQAAETRTRILDAAVEVLHEQGYAGASTLQVQQRAGLSRGGLLHQFASRDELLVAAVNHLTRARVVALAENRTWPSDPADRIEAAVAQMWLQYRQPFFWVSLELWLAARHNGSIARELVPRERELGVLIQESTESFFGARLAAHPAYLHLVDLLVTSMRGVGITYAMTPDRDPEHDPHVRVWNALACHLLLGEPFGLP